MSEDPILKRVTKIRGLFADGSRKIGDYNQLLPRMQETDSYLRWIEESQRAAPTGIQTVNEDLLNYLDGAEYTAAFRGTIPAVPGGTAQYVTTSGSAPGYEHGVYLRDVRSHYADAPAIVTWVDNSLKAGEELQAVQRRSDKVQQRLIRLDPSLGELHRQARDAALTARATNQEIVEAASLLDRVLERFFGEVWKLAKVRGKATYKTLSEKLAANVPLTKDAIANGQITYDRLNFELMRVRKSMVTATGSQVVELLREVEAHIDIITGALDPKLTGIEFEV